MSNSENNTPNNMNLDEDEEEIIFENNYTVAENLVEEMKRQGSQ